MLSSGALHGRALAALLKLPRSAMYSSLRSMERRGFLASYTEPGFSTTRRVYAITDLGLAVSRAYDAARRAFNHTPSP